MAGFLNGSLVLDEVTFTTSSGNNNDVPMSGSLMYIDVSNNNDTITGIATDQVLGFMVFLVNTGPTNNLILKNNSSLSAVGHRIISYNGTDITVAPLQTALLWYDTVALEWNITKFA